METPVSIQVVPQQVIRDQQALTLSRVLENVSGVRTYDPTFNARGADTFQIRGFETPYVYVDGLRMISADSQAGSVSLANVDRVEVLKGPASILYGRADPGGIVNIVTKKPLETPQYSVSQLFGSWNTYQTVGDATGPLDKAHRLYYRVTAAVENSHSFRDLNYMQNYFVAPVVRWEPDADTQITVNASYKHQVSPYDTGAFAFTKYDYALFGNPLALMWGPGPLAKLPRSVNYSEPNSNSTTDRFMFGYNASRKLTEGWTLTHRFEASFTNSLQRWVVPFLFGAFTSQFEPSNTAVNRFAIYQEPHNRVYSTNVDLTGEFDTFGVGHTVLVGGDFLYTSTGNSALVNQPFSAFAPPDIDLLFPIHTFTPTDKYLYDPASQQWNSNRQHWYGFYLQDQIKLPYNLFLLAGGRYDHANSYQNNFDDKGEQVSDNSQRVTPRVGLLWRPIPQASLYGSYLTNFGPGGIGGPGQVLPPQSAEQWETGLKTEWFDGRVTATIAYYNLIKTNVPAPDPDPVRANQGYLVALGATRNKGVELDVAGEVLPGLRVIGNYAYIDSLVVKDTATTISDPLGNILSYNGYQGFTPPGVSRHMGSLWSTYELQTGDLKGLKFGGGATARSLSYADLLGSFHLPGYATVGLMASYEWTLNQTKFSAQLNVDNLLDTRYYPNGVSPTGVFIGAPRNFKGSIRMAF